jgi:hypothetical protein
MKVRLQLMTVFAAFLLSLPAFASSIQRWEGAGVSLTPDGKELGTFKISTTVSHPSVDIAQAETLITLEDGTVKTSSMTITEKGTGFSTDSSFGKGGGACYGAGICESYIVSGTGQSFATTIIEDSDGSRRSLTIVLENGRAVKVLRDKVSLQ